MKRILSLLLLIGILLSMMPTKTHAATLADYRKLLKQYKQELANSQAAINKTEAEIASTNKEIKRLREETISMTAELAVLKEFVPETLSPEKMKEEIQAILDSLSAEERTLKNIMPRLKAISGMDMKAAKDLVAQML